MASKSIAMNSTLQEVSEKNEDPLVYIAKMLKVAAVMGAPAPKVKERSNRARELSNVAVRPQEAVEDRMECYDLLSRLTRSKSIVSYVVMMKLCRVPEGDIASTLQVTRQRVNNIYQEFVNMAKNYLRQEE